MPLHTELAPGSRAAGSAVLTNRGSSEIRVWRTGNSWGDEALSFEGTRGRSVHRIMRDPQVYTRNVPLFVSLKPGERYEIPFDLRDGSWPPEAAIRRLQAPGVQLAAVYEVPRSPEATAHAVWSGQVRSESVTVSSGSRRE